MRLYPRTPIPPNPHTFFPPLTPLTCCSNCAINHGRETSNVYREEIRLEIDKQKLVPFAIIGLVAMLALLPAILHI
jgi:hypothetical protein